ncbi:MATE family efflux transporter [Klugiella xanthotipulae]|uniref:Probable multidrug resistance protein NorM n=1 Tax=Klugiella xanthotipulae TaxID=244735 RepID=A0A543I6X7_9MICO|nr:MATE family efflux transporter [Klugiella xanthotipulae]TQM66356.1 putative MATE family efflux protein [Klugiella xanthotipulae]
MRLTDTDRSIGRLAIPALGALIAEPLFLLADSALVGHLGAAQLGGVAVAAAILQTVIGLMVFLAYATTPLVARRMGAGDPRGAVAVGIDGLWFAGALGLVVAAVGGLGATPLIALVNPSPEVAEHAHTFLTVSLLGVPAMLIVFAATGLLRGIQNTITPLWVALGGCVLNVGLNAVLIYGLGWGVLGSAIGTVAVQWGMVAVYVIVCVRLARRVGATRRPSLAGIRLGAANGGWLFVRTLSLRASLLITIFVATKLGTDELASYHVVYTLFSTAAFALDSIAIAAQALVGTSLGAGDRERTRLIVTRCIRWGVRCGLAGTLLMAALSPVLGNLFSRDPQVLGMLTPAILVMSLSLGLGGYVWVVDGVLMGAGDVRYLAAVGAVNLLLYLPIAAAVWRWAPGGVGGVCLLTASFTIGYMLVRACTLGLRVRGNKWIAIAA